MGGIPPQIPPPQIPQVSNSFSTPLDRLAVRLVCWAVVRFSDRKANGLVSQPYRLLESGVRPHEQRPWSEM